MLFGELLAGGGCGNKSDAASIGTGSTGAGGATAGGAGGGITVEGVTSGGVTPGGFASEGVTSGGGTGGGITGGGTGSPDAARRGAGRAETETAGGAGFSIVIAELVMATLIAAIPGSVRLREAWGESEASEEIW